MLLTGLVSGLLVAAAVLAAVTALAPQPVPLARRLRTVLDLDPPEPRDRVAPLKRLARRLQPAEERLYADLEVVGMTIEKLTARQLLWALAGALAPLLFWPAGLAALGAPWAVAPVAATAGAAVGWWVALHELRDQADRRRREMGLALAAYLQLAATMIRAGTAEEQALRDAAHAGSGWAFQTIQGAVDRAVQSGTTLAQAFDELGGEVGLVELKGLAAELRIASRQGSSPARSLTARAASLREQEQAAQLAAAGRTEKHLAAPIVGLGLCVVVFVIFPAVATIVGL